MKNVIYTVCAGVIMLAIGAGSAAIVKVNVLEEKVDKLKEDKIELSQDIKDIKKIVTDIQIRLGR